VWLVDVKFGELWCILCGISYSFSRLLSTQKLTQGGPSNLHKGGRPFLFPSYPFSSTFPTFLPSPLLRSRLLKTARRPGERCKSSPSGFRGGAPAENEFGALKATGGNRFKYYDYHILQ